MSLTASSSLTSAGAKRLCSTRLASATSRRVVTQQQTPLTTQHQNLHNSIAAPRFVPSKSPQYTQQRSVRTAAEEVVPEEEVDLNTALNSLNNLQVEEVPENIFADDIPRLNRERDEATPIAPRVRRRAELGEASFDDLGVPSALIGILERFNIKAPSAIQKLAIGHLIRRYDVRTNKVYVPPNIAIQDYTGSGKTLAYALPLMANINNTIDRKIPPPHVIGMMHKLRGVSLPSPPALAIDPTMADEYERPRIIMYGKDDVFTGDGAQEDADNEDIHKWLFEDHIHDEAMTEQEWQEYVFKRAKQAENSKTAPVNLVSRLFTGSDRQMDPSFSLEAQRLKRKARLMSKLKEIFPTMNEDMLDPDNPQSRLQAIIVVPTKELAQQITNTLNDINPTVFISQHQDFRASPVGNNLYMGVKKDRNGIITRMVAGQVGVNMLKSLGISVVPKEEEDTTGLRDYSGEDANKQIAKMHNNQPPPPAIHPFVTFGKGHPLYREDQDQIRANVIGDEKEKVLRGMRDRERQLEMERLARVKAEEEERRRLGIERDDDRDSLFNDANESLEDDYAALNDAEERAEARRMLSPRDKRKMKLHDGAPLVEDKRMMGQRIKGKDYQNKVAAEREQRERALKRKDEEANVTAQYKLAPSPLLYEQLGASLDDTIEMDRGKQPHILVGTPSTVAALIKSGAVQLPSTGPSPAQLKYLIFDEIDHLARNDTSPDHRAVLELMSIPNDQTVFVSASMTRETALFMTRLARRQTLPSLSLNPKHETYTGMLTLPRPAEAQLNDDEVEEAFKEAEVYAQEQWQTYLRKVEVEGLAPVLNKKGEVVPVDKEVLMEKAQRKIMSKASTPYLPARMLAHLPYRAQWNGLPISTDASSVGEVLFLSPEDYRSTADAEGANAMPLPPYLKHYYLKVPKGTNKQKVLMDLICQLKVKPRRGMNAAMPTATLTEDQYLSTGSSKKKVNVINGTAAAVPKSTSKSRKGDSVFLDSNADLTTLLTGSVESVQAQANDDLIPADEYTRVSAPKEAVRKPNQTTVAASGFDTNRPVVRSATAQSVCPGNILVFFSKSHSNRTKSLQKMLSSVDLSVGLFHSSATRQERTEVLHKNRDLDVIFSNESLSRGIDMKELSLIINLDVPRSTTTYLHRAGRVARMGATHRRRSVVLNIISDADENGNEKFEYNVKFRGGSSTTDDETLLRKHITKLGIKMQPWPYRVPYNIHKTLVKSYNVMRDEEFRKQNARLRGQSKVAGKKGLHADEDGTAMPTRTAMYRDAGVRAATSERGRSLADSSSWMSWDSNSKGWK